MERNCVPAGQPLCQRWWYSEMKSPVIFLTLWVLLSGQLATAAPSEFELKVAYLNHFIAFTRGFEVSDNKLRVGLYVTPELYKVYSELDGKSTVHGTIELQRLNTHSDLLKCCDVLFYGAGTNASVPPKSLEHPTLTISDHKNEIFGNVMIKFVRYGGKLKFRINIEYAKQAGLTFDSHLINVAIR